MSTLQSISFNRIDGNASNLGEFDGKVLLIVNVASKCGLTPQYEGLEKLYQQYKSKGLEIIGFPANNFAAQEPGSNEEIASFCSANYGVSFPMAEKISVNGEDRHPLYAALIAAQPSTTGRNSDNGLLIKLNEMGLGPKADDDVMWNFEKFLIGKDGAVIGRFSPDTAPDDAGLVAAIEAAL